MTPTVTKILFADTQCAYQHDLRPQRAHARTPRHLHPSPLTLVLQQGQERDAGRDLPDDRLDLTLDLFFGLVGARPDDK